MHRAGFDPTQPFVVSKPDFMVNGKPYAVGDQYTPDPDVGLRMLRQWYDFGWLSHERPSLSEVRDGTPLQGDGPEPPKGKAVHSSPGRTASSRTRGHKKTPPKPAAPVKSKSGKVRIQDPNTKRLKWVPADQVEV